MELQKGSRNGELHYECHAKGTAQQPLPSHLKSAWRQRGQFLSQESETSNRQLVEVRRRNTGTTALRLCCDWDQFSEKSEVDPSSKARCPQASITVDRYSAI